MFIAMLLTNEKIQPITTEFVMWPYISSPILNFIAQRRISKMISSMIVIIAMINYMHHHSDYLVVFHSLSFIGIFSKKLCWILILRHILDFWVSL